MVDAVVTINSEDGIISEVNNSALRMFGYEKNEMLGKNVIMLMPEPHKSQHHQYLERYLKTGEAKVIGKGRELQAQRKDGTMFWIHLTVCEIVLGGRKHFTAFIRDIQEQKDASEQLSVAMQKFGAIFQFSLDALVVTNTKGIITECSNSCMKLFGYSKEEMLGQNVSMLASPRYADKHDDYIEAYLRTGIKRAIGKQREAEGKKKDGTLFPFELSLSEVKTEQIHLFVGSIRDLTEKKQKVKFLAKKLALSDACLQERQEELLMNMIPRSVAEKLMDESNSHIAEHFDDATILFADVVGFTKMSEGEDFFVSLFLCSR